MKIVGLITEYNPFHNGHQYHIEKAKEVTGADTAIAKYVLTSQDAEGGVPVEGGIDMTVTGATRTPNAVIAAVNATQGQVIANSAGEVVYVKAADIPESVTRALKSDPSARLVVADTAKIVWSGAGAAAAMVKFLLNCHKNAA